MPAIPFWDLTNIRSIVGTGNGCRQGAATLNNDKAAADRMRAILIEARENKGLSRVALSRALGMYKNFVWKYEHGERSIKDAEFVRIARELGIDPAGAVREVVATSYDSNQNEPVRSQYAAGTPLAQKLGIRPNMRLFAIGAPAHYLRLLEPLPEGVKLVARLTRSTHLIHVFVTQRRKLEAILKSLSGKLRDDAAVWVSWPKRSSKEYTNVTADVVLDAAVALGLVEVDMCAVDATWSGLKLMSEKKRRD